MNTSRAVLLMASLSFTIMATGQPTSSVPIFDNDGNRIVLTETRHQSGYDWHDYARTVYSYDAYGINTALRYATRDFEGAWSNRYHVQYDHDSAGRTIVFELRYESGLIHDGQDVRYTYAYDDNGRLLESRAFVPDGDSWKVSNRTLYSYDTEGRELHQIWQHALPEDSWRTWQEVEFTYDDVTGSVTEVLRHADESNDMILLSRTVTTRDGNERSALRQSYRGGDQWDNVTLRTSTVDESGEEIAWTNAYWLNGEWSYNYRFRTLPSDVSSVSATVNETFDGSEWMPTLRTTTTIGQYGVPEIVAEESFASGQWQNRTRQVHTYVPLTAVSSETENAIADGFILLGNYPNPFNPSTAIRYEIRQAGHVFIGVFDVMGRHVTTIVDGQMPAGSHEAIFEAGHLPSGVYFSRMNVDGRTSTRPMTLVK